MNDAPPERAPTDPNASDELPKLAGPAEDRILKSTPVFQGRVINLETNLVKLPGGAEVELDLFRHPGASAIVALGEGEDPDVTLIRQYRYATGGYLWEVPAGTLEAGEAPEACAQRELLEEAGLRASRWAKLGAIYTIPSFCTEIIHLFVAEDLSGGSAQHDDDEVITDVRAVPLSQALAWVIEGRIVDAKSVAALAQVHMRRTLHKAV